MEVQRVTSLRVQDEYPATLLRTGRQLIAIASVMNWEGFVAQKKLDF
jgi:hypothetical protein